MDTGVAGVGNEGIESWLQYALRTYGVSEWTRVVSVAAGGSEHSPSQQKLDPHSQSSHNYS